MPFDDFDPDIDFEPDMEAAPKVELDPLKLQHYIDLRRSQQQLPFATLAGFIGALIGSAVWLGFTVAANTQIGWMALGVGLIVGAMVRHTGQGFDRIFGVMAATAALAGCAIGTLLAGCWLLSVESEQLFFADLVLSLTPGLVTGILRAMLSTPNLVFGGVAVIGAYWISVRRIRRRERAFFLVDPTPRRPM